MAGGRWELTGVRSLRLLYLSSLQHPPASMSFPKLVGCGEVPLADYDLRSFRQLGSSDRIRHFRWGPNLCNYKVSP